MNCTLRAASTVLCKPGISLEPLSWHSSAVKRHAAAHNCQNNNWLSQNLRFFFNLESKPPCVAQGSTNNRCSRHPKQTWHKRKWNGKKTFLLTQTISLDWLNVMNWHWSCSNKSSGSPITRPPLSAFSPIGCIERRKLWKVNDGRLGNFSADSTKLLDRNLNLYWMSTFC